MANNTSFSETVPPLASLPRCVSCNKPHIPRVPGAERCFICDRRKRRTVGEVHP